MNKLSGIFLLFGFLGANAMALNFSGFQSLSGLGTAQIFAAPVSGVYYFLNGQLTLPSPSTNGETGFSQVVATVSKNQTTLLYTGAAGATGFQLNQILLTTADSIWVNLGSTALIDTVTQSGVRGQVSFGNTF